MRGPRRASPALCLVALAAAASGCRDAPPEPAVDRTVIAIATDSIAVRTGSVGEGAWRKQASYVLAEVRNRGDEDLLVTLGGALLPASGGAAAWPLERESLRVPAGGTRLFALVDREGAARAAGSAEVTLAGAVRVRYAPPFSISEGTVMMDQDRAVAAGNVRNTADRAGKAVVIGAFFDAAGKPVDRTSTVFPLAAGGTRGIRLVGPPGSRSAYLFIGEVEF